MEADAFKLLSTVAVFIVVTMWAFKNMRAINDWIVGKTGIGKTREEKIIQRRTSSGTELNITVNTSSSNTEG